MFKNDLIDTRKYDDSNNIDIAEFMPKFPYRWCFIGSSGAGKTNALLNILNHLHFDKLILICPTCKYQPKYRYLTDKLDKKHKSLEKKLPKGYNLAPLYELYEELPSDLLDSLDTRQQNLIIFDDMLAADKKSQLAITDIFIRGRHKNTALIYLSQSYYKIPKTIRLQCNAINIFHGVSEAELGYLYRDIGIGIGRKTFINKISDLIAKPYSFVHINMDSNTPYRDTNFNEIVF